MFLFSYIKVSCFASNSLQYEVFQETFRFSSFTVFFSAGKCMLFKGSKRFSLLEVRVAFGLACRGKEHTTVGNAILGQQWLQNLLLLWSLCSKFDLPCKLGERYNSTPNLITQISAPILSRSDYQFTYWVNWWDSLDAKRSILG